MDEHSPTPWGNHYFRSVDDRSRVAKIDEASLFPEFRGHAKSPRILRCLEIEFTFLRPKTSPFLLGLLITPNSYFIWKLSALLVLRSPAQGGTKDGCALMYPKENGGGPWSRTRNTELHSVPLALASARMPRSFLCVKSILIRLRRNWRGKPINRSI